jgi:choloylglycine hydrolase
MLRKITSAALAGAVALAPVAQACTGIELTAKDGGVVAARTLEFGIDPKSEVMVVPAGTAITGTLPDGGKGISYVTKYGVVGANGFGQPVILDGINEAGLYVGLFYFPGYASYADATKDNASRAMGPHEYGIWLLGNFASVDEVAANFDKVVLAPVVVDALKEVPPVHFVVHDRTGKSIVIEPVDKVLKLHQNPLGVMTNSPTFDWHMTNLRNYVNLSVTNVPPIALRDIKLGQFGEGSGMHGLPGDFTTAVAVRARRRLLASRHCIRHGAAIRAASVPHPEQFRYSSGLRASDDWGHAHRGVHRLDQRIRSQKSSLALSDLQ